MSIHDGHRERMKERFAEYGLESFNELNTLELLLFYAIPRRDTNPIAHALLEEFGSLQEVFDASEQELLQVEESIYSGLTETYGEEQGEKMWYKSPVYTFLESAKREVKILLGDSLELSFSGALDKVEETAEKEGVC